MNDRSRKINLRALRQEAYLIHEARADLQKAFPDPGSEEFWRWVHEFGPWEHDELKALTVPVPPAEVRRYVAPDRKAYRHGGAAAHEVVCSAVANAGLELATLGAVLDLGCGPGRCLRYFLHHAQDVMFTGIDVDRQAIEWAQAQFPFGEFQTIEDTPPTRLPADTFDLAYSISLFSHLSEENHHEWLGELARLCRRQALVVLTTHGHRALERAKMEPAIRTMLGVSRRALHRARRQLDACGFAFIRQHKGHLNRDLYGITFISPEYISSEWSKHFHLDSIRPGALEDWQDVVVLRA